MTKSEVYYQAMLARDYRFDGKFFVGVKTTGIYCRPICPAKPKRENIEFFSSATAAEKSGYRPCLRCRPESAPLSPAWFGKSAVVQRALRTIAVDGFFESDEDTFAQRFGVTARHLRRLFVDELGQTPKQIAFNNRLNFSRKLVVESRLPLTSVALVAGFSSVRRFNDAFKKRFKRSPSTFRKKRESRLAGEAIELSLPYRPPLDWPHLLNFYRGHRITGVETVTDHAYERVFRFGTALGALQVRQDPNKPQLRLRVAVDDPAVLFAVVQRVRRMFDLDSDPLLIANSFRGDRLLNSLWKKYPGLRVARGWDAFETSICTILGQLVSVRQATVLVRQLVESHGQKITHPSSGQEGFLFPSPEILATADLDSVRTSQARKNAIREFSRRVVSKNLKLEIPQSADLSREQILSIAGLGPWSSEYIHLRGLGDTDAFPKTDLILKRAIEKHPGLDLEKVRPWRSYAAIYLWKHYAEKLSDRKERE